MSDNVFSGRRNEERTAEVTASVDRKLTTRPPQSAMGALQKSPSTSERPGASPSGHRLPCTPSNEHAKALAATTRWSPIGVTKTGAPSSSQPSPVKDREPLSDHLDLELVNCADGAVEVAQEHIGGCSGASHGKRVPPQTPMRSCASLEPLPRATCTVRPKESSGRPHRQKREDTGRGR